LVAAMEADVANPVWKMYRVLRIGV